MFNNSLRVSLDLEIYCQHVASVEMLNTLKYDTVKSRIKAHLDIGLPGNRLTMVIMQNLSRF